MAAHVTDAVDQEQGPFEKGAYELSKAAARDNMPRGQIVPWSLSSAPSQ